MQLSAEQARPKQNVTQFSHGHTPTKSNHDDSYRTTCVDCKETHVFLRLQQRHHDHGRTTKRDNALSLSHSVFLAVAIVMITTSLQGCSCR